MAIIIFFFYQKTSLNIAHVSSKFQKKNYDAYFLFFHLKFSIKVQAKVFEIAHKALAFSVLKGIHKQSIVYH